MAIVRPFPSLRPAKDLAAKICELPYDVVSTAEARDLAAGNPLSFFHVSRPEIDFPPDADASQQAVYARGRNNFWHLMAIQALRPDPQPCFYLYRQVWGGHAQTGLVATFSCEEYHRGVIKKHELTRPEKEEDRTRHIDILSAQTGPAFLVYRSAAALNGLYERILAGSPAVDFVAGDGVRHVAWVIQEAGDIQAIQTEFAGISHLYIADGHHRSAAACRVWEERHGSGESAYFLAVVFPHDQVKILPYNRVVKDLAGQDPAAFLRKLAEVFEFSGEACAAPKAKHHVGLYLDGRWHGLRFHPRLVPEQDPVASLDASLLQSLVLAPLLDIANPRTSDRIQFVGGIRGPQELENLVDGGQFACAFSLFPTQVEEVMKVADAQGIMPPKSTWFEPKLRDGMFCHLI